LLHSTGNLYALTRRLVRPAPAALVVRHGALFCLLEEPKVVTVVPDLNDLSAFDREDADACELNVLAGGVDGPPATSVGS
jgi:hypothetical protein